ncbi:MAG: cob(I)yrinic acid a,c-diamide adenosyltransferase [Prevotellaceae bacterium]|jgi:cob(I)alamin adenosyltransferase|nr:cob(I)yrinic acid a,c-diamide adenosyltransferase [Prevotellaceae bacterium]
MKIYTTTGDSGTTSLAGGARVPKYHPRVEAYGTLDELCSQVGLLRMHVTTSTLREQLLEIQKLLMKCGSILSNTGKSPYQVKDGDILQVETWIDSLQSQLPDLKNFTIPGGNVAAAQSHVARCVCRRAERATVLLASENTAPENVVKYLNRLSDYLFVLARTLCKEQNISDEIWMP